VADAIQVEGLTEFTRKLRKLDADLPKALRLGFNDTATIVVDYAVSRVPRRTGKAARSIKAKSTRTAVRIAGGGKSAPYYPFLDFGGRVGRDKSVKREFLPDGRYIYEGYYTKKSEFAGVLSNKLADVARQAGLVMD